jgi:hypothetical protein
VNSTGGVVTRTIPWHPSDAGGPLGRHVEHDPASRAYGVFAAGTVALHRVVWRRYGDLFTQRVGSCTGEAGAGALNTEGLRAVVRPRHRRLFTQADAEKFYSLATTLDSFPGTWPPEDTGSSGLAVCKGMVQLGYLQAYRHAFSLQEALQALMAGPVLTGTDWYEGMDTPDDHGRVKIAGQVRGGHEYLAVGYDPSTDLVLFDNSWGRSWGLRGTFLYTSKMWGQLLAGQGDVTVPVA